MSSRVILPSKLQGEDTYVFFDFASRLAVGETIASGFVTATTWSGTDASPSAIVSGSAVLFGTQVNQLIINGVEGVIYDLVASANTSAGQVLQLSGFLAVVAPT